MRNDIGSSQKLKIIVISQLLCFHYLTQFFGWGYWGWFVVTCNGNPTSSMIYRISCSILQLREVHLVQLIYFFRVVFICKWIILDQLTPVLCFILRHGYQLTLVKLFHWILIIQLVHVLIFRWMSGVPRVVVDGGHGCIWVRGSITFLLIIWDVLFLMFLHQITHNILFTTTLHGVQVLLGIPRLLIPRNVN